MMVISMPEGILALKLCTEKKILQIFCAKMVRSVTLFRNEKLKIHFYQASILKLVSELNLGVYVLMY